MKHRLFCLLASTLGPLVVWALCRFVRVRMEGFEQLQELRAAGRNVIYALWHSRLLYFCYCPEGRGTAVMVSKNRDGEYITRVMKWFGHTAVRGSTSRNSGPALREMARMVQDGWNAAITVDGPRGPAEKVQGGVVQLAALTGAAIVPVSLYFCPVWRLSSWDRFILPRGYGRGMLVIGAPIEVASHCSKDQLEEKRMEVQRALDALTARAESEA